MIIPDTFLSVHEETVLFIASVFLGAALSIIYCLILAFRAAVPHKAFSAAAEDVLFILLWAAAAACFTTVLGNGVFRIFYIAGSILGFILMHLTVGRPAARLLSRIFSAVYAVICRILSPLNKLIVRMRKKCTAKFVTNAKNKEKRKNIWSALLIAKVKMLYNNIKSERKSGELGNGKQK